MEVIVFGMENCAGCGTVKRLLKENDVKFVERDVMNPEHMAEAQKYFVRGVPSVVFQYESGGSVMITGSTPKDIAQIRQLAGI